MAKQALTESNLSALSDISNSRQIAEISAPVKGKEHAGALNPPPKLIPKTIERGTTGGRIRYEDSWQPEQAPEPPVQGIRAMRVDRVDQPALRESFKASSLLEQPARQPKGLSSFGFDGANDSDADEDGARHDKHEGPLLSWDATPQVDTSVEASTWIDPPNPADVEWDEWRIQERQSDAFW